MPVSVATRFTYELRMAEDASWRRNCSAFMPWGPAADPLESLHLGLTYDY